MNWKFTLEVLALIIAIIAVALYAPPIIMALLGNKDPTRRS